MFWKFMTVFLCVIVFSIYAHDAVNKTAMPALAAQNAALTKQVSDLQSANATLVQEKNGYAGERDKAVADLNQLKTLAQAISATTKPIVK